MEVEELETENKFTLTVIRHHSSYRKVVLDWIAERNINDISPSSGMVNIT